MVWFSLFLRFIFVCVLFLFQYIQQTDVFPIPEFCLILAFSALHLLARPLKHHFLLYVGLFYLITFFFDADLQLYAPVVFYEWTFRSSSSFLILCVPFMAGLLLGDSFYLSLFITGISLIGIFLHTVIEKSHSFEQTSYLEIDTLRHLNEDVKKEQERLLEMQDERVLSTLLEERKRIVSEIHDTLGHQLSSSIIQIGALQYLVDDPIVKDSLLRVQHVLTTSMDNVRSIVHTERQTAFHLEHELQQMVDHFTKCPIFYQYRIYTPMNSFIGHAILLIVKEGLTNINKHSNATSVQISLTETKQQFVLLIADNGKVTQQKMENSKGIGILNMEERTEKLGGKLHLNFENGFRIFITIPIQEERDDENTDRG